MTRIHTPKLGDLIVPGSSIRKIYGLDTQSVSLLHPTHYWKSNKGIGEG